MGQPLENSGTVFTVHTLKATMCQQVQCGPMPQYRSLQRPVQVNANYQSRIHSGNTPQVSRNL